jgi:hypothetical protein
MPKSLVICYFFPPYPRVGGRRWAKFAKYFHKKGHDLDILAGDFEGNSSWDKDIADLNHKITRVPLKKANPKYFMTTLPTGILSKIRWKASYLSSKMAKVPLDESELNKVAFANQLKELLAKNEYSEILITGGPWSYLDILTEVSIPKSTKVYLDLRDEWPYPENWSEDQISREKVREDKIIAAADYLLFTEKTVMSKYEKDNKCFHVPHALDEDDFENFIGKKTTQDTIKIIFGGDFYGADEGVHTYDKFIGKLRERSPKAVGKIFSPMADSVEKNMNLLHLNVDGQRPLNEYFEEISTSTATVYIRSEETSHYFSSKFYELVKFGKPILYFGPKGTSSEFIEGNGLGFHVTESNLEECVEKLLSNIDSNAIPRDYDLSQHTFEHEADKLIKIIEGNRG